MYVVMWSEIVLKLRGSCTALVDCIYFLINHCELRLGIALVHPNNTHGTSLSSSYFSWIYN